MSYKYHDNRRGSSGYGQGSYNRRDNQNYSRNGDRNNDQYKPRDERGSRPNIKASLQTGRDGPGKPKFQKQGNQMERPNQVVVPEAVRNSWFLFLS